MILPPFFLSRLRQASVDAKSQSKGFFFLTFSVNGIIKFLKRYVYAVKGNN
jgi:hypothetical protein